MSDIRLQSYISRIWNIYVHEDNSYMIITVIYTHKMTHICYTLLHETEVCYEGNDRLLVCYKQVVCYNAGRFVILTIGLLY